METTELLKKLHPIAVRMALEGPYYDPHRIAMLAAGMGRQAVEALLSDPALIGCFVSDAETRREYVDLAHWLNENHPSAPQLQELSTKYCVVKHYGNKTQVFFMKGGKWVNISPDQMKLAHANMPWCEGRTKKGKMIIKNAAEVWLEHPATIYYESAEFLPGQIAPPDILNLWIPPKLKPCEDYVISSEDDLWKQKWCDFPDTLLLRAPKFAEHMLSNMCGGDYEQYSFLVGWMIDAVVNMYRSNEVAVVLRGDSGSGKGYWAKHFMEFFAPHTITLSNPKHLTGSFNKHLQCVKAVFADEAFFGANNQSHATLKTLISDTEIFVEPKGVDGFMADKFWVLILASNNDQVVHITANERRFFVMEVDAGKHNNDGEYFAGLQKAWDDGERDALYYWLTSPEAEVWSYHTWDSHDIPDTPGRQAQQNLSLDAVEAVVYAMLMHGDVRCEHELRPGGVFVPTFLLGESVKLDSSDVTKLGLLLGKIAGSTSTPGMVGTGPQRRQRRGFELPTLAVCRANWDAHYGRPGDWPDEPDSWLQDQPF